mmetsp:Transcript_13928/g.29393  ORF Transcript_13928/g.29393 Transcript_13928/m.29393 type:complete len:85 (-) Transcript_13928:28-282(-)
MCIIQMDPWSRDHRWIRVFPKMCLCPHHLILKRTKAGREDGNIMMLLKTSMKIVLLLPFEIDSKCPYTWIYHESSQCLFFPCSF